MIISSYSLIRERGEYELVITEPEATNCSSINIQVNIIMILSREHHGVNTNFASDKASFCKIQTLLVKNFTLRVLSDLYFINFAFLFFIACYRIQISQVGRS